MIGTGCMDSYAVVTATFFDGEQYHSDGPYTAVVEQGTIAGIERGDVSVALGRRDIRVTKKAFIMPGLVEAHSHLFLDGGQLDFTIRNEYLNAPGEEMLAVARDNIAANLAAGVTLVVDAGDRYGINHLSRLESGRVTVRSAGMALRRPGRYGGFMAREVTSGDEISRAIREISTSADDLKVILTGIIDFKAGVVKGEPQFDREELRSIVLQARALGLRTFVHCSGVAGLEVAVAAGVDSIEHGFFMTRDILKSMADRGISWVPTFSPVHFQWQRPELAGWDAKTVANLRRILDSHLEHVAIAADLGVPLVAGSDAGSHGVRHGEALIAELDFFSRTGLPMDAVLRSATSLPRKRWGAEAAMLEVGQRADFISLEGSPFKDARYLHNVEAVFGSTH
ncbi:MAG: amidohydrolase family protein [Desulfuromonadaceae bacterium]|nr:amidohydrolase family protein [Desulfuromonadaceae bacterium]